MSPADLVVVDGGASVARQVLAGEQRGYWSSALPVVLEKHGYVGFDVLDAAMLQDPDALKGRAGALITRLPDRSWPASVVELIRDPPCPLLLESPLPARVLRALGVEGSRKLDAPGRLIPERTLRDGIRGRGLRGSVPISDRRIEEGRDGDPSLHWRVLAPGLIGPDHARAWRSRGWDAFEWRLADDIEVLATWISPGGSRSPAVVRRGSVTAASFGLFAYLGQAHTAEPWELGELVRGPDTHGLELVFLELIDRMHASARLPRARVLPWPAGHAWALNVRHDFDRSMGRAAVARSLARHRAAGTSATWYWRARHLRDGKTPLPHLVARSVVHTALDHPEPGTGKLAPSLPRMLVPGNRALRKVARQPGHEVALHTEMMWLAAGRERRLVERVAGTRVVGSSSHGDLACFRFQGAPNILWAEGQGLIYTENLQAPHRRPYRFVALEPDGEIRALSVLCLPKHSSLDVGLSSTKTWREKIVAAHPEWRAAGGFMQLMNHPDINQDVLFAVIAGFAHEDRWDVTAAEAATWWSSTHTRGAVRALSAAAGSLSIERSPTVPSGIQLEVVEPSGGRSVRVLPSHDESALPPPVAPRE